MKSFEISHPKNENLKGVPNDRFLHIQQNFIAIHVSKLIETSRFQWIFLPKLIKLVFF